MSVDALVTTGWVAEHHHHPEVVVAEVDEDPTTYQRGHIPGAVGFDWTVDFHDPFQRGILRREPFERLMDARGIDNHSHVVLYGDNNWFAAYVYWHFKIYGHDTVSLMDGGRKLWRLQGRTLTAEQTPHQAGQR
ncbi:MAG: hypothetical protein KY460_17505 [Actinobacteria bacterium]|nr:hypothetical protein [Actinomycetota bacterium]